MNDIEKSTVNMLLFCRCYLEQYNFTGLIYYVEPRCKDEIIYNRKIYKKRYSIGRSIFSSRECMEFLLQIGCLGSCVYA